MLSLDDFVKLKSVKIMDEKNKILVNCDCHGSQEACVVCAHILLAKDKSVGFIENGSQNEGLQAWCHECESLFQSEGSLTDAFRKFHDLRVVCVECYSLYRNRHQV